MRQLSQFDACLSAAECYERRSQLSLPPFHTLDLADRSGQLVRGGLNADLWTKLPIKRLLCESQTGSSSRISNAQLPVIAVLRLDGDVVDPPGPHARMRINRPDTLHASPAAPAPKRRRRRALPSTNTLDIDIAAAANTGDSSAPKAG